ncbi:hypothetical protein SSX86_003009 [Deinandra increscens subsp. villosa]|uniref:FAS1 domain-containing protein n=1 Tax=Deinandra increscens subsp. villosa TaxID=3103831 RepID=A0AAP0DHL1_9ASTR
MSMLKSSNGLMNTLTTDIGKKYDFTVQNDGQDVTIKTGTVTAKIVGTLIDQQPLVIFTVDKVLLPNELFKGAVSPAPAASPKSGKKKKQQRKSTPAPASSESPADSPDDAVADEEADSNNGGGINGFRFAAMGLSLSFLFAERRSPNQHKKN